jgi:hypothetical protein
MNGTREYVMDELGDPDAPIGSKPWALWLSNEIRRVYYDKQRTGDRLRQLLETCKEHEVWQTFGYLTWDQYCKKRLQVQVDEIETEADKRLLDHGGDRRSKTFQVDARQLERRTQGGNSTDYWKSRLERDAPEYFRRYDAGDFPSVAEACYAAGIRERKQRYFLSDDPKTAGAYLGERVDQEWFEQMIDAYYRAQE